VLAYLGTRPRTSYLGRVRNPNAAMPGAQYVGHTSVIEKPEPTSKGETDKPASTSTAMPNGNHVELNKLNLEKLIG
jgi:hypothetical protein